MATIVPPPSKKVKRELAANANIPVESRERPNAPNIVVQFTSSKDGSSLGPPIRLPADTDRAGLELLANQLRKAQRQLERAKRDRRELKEGEDEEQDGDDDDDEPTPYSFRVSLPKAKNAPDQTGPQDQDSILVTKDLHDVIQKNESSLSIEDVLNVVCEPEAIFKVRQITRCSSTLSGEHVLIFILCILY
jgi:ribosome assembly protein 4